MSSPSNQNDEEKTDRVSQILSYLEDPTLDNLPDNLKMKYKDGWDPDNLEEELQQHPFFCTELPDPTKPLPPLLEAFQQLKYSEEENSAKELAVNHKEDGVFHFKIKKYRVASHCFTTALGFALKDEDPVDGKLVAQLYNNRSACMWFLGNYRSCYNDCIKALEHDPDYFKALKRGVSCLEKLERWDELVELCDKWEESFANDPERLKVFVAARGVARKHKSRVMAEERKREQDEEVKEEVKRSTMSVVKQRAYKLRNNEFMDHEAAAREGKVVKLDGEGVLHWPVLFLYPQYSQSDFVEEFAENDCFITHLQEILDKDPPHWDREQEYRSDLVEVWYLGDKFIRVNEQASLHEVMSEKYYWVPSNGVPCFFILNKDNQFCKDFKERVDVEGEV